MNSAIRKMVATPGIHAVTASLGSYFLVEVTKNGTVFQLTSRGKRDGILRPDGWHPATVILQSKPPFGECL